MDPTTKLIYMSLVFIGLAGIVVGIPSSIFFAIKAHRTQDIIFKKKIKRKALWFILAPLLLLIAAAVFVYLAGFFHGALFGK